MPVHLECLSHTPLQGLVDPSPDVVAEVEATLAAARARVEAFAPELVILFSPDHYNGFFYKLMPAYCVGYAATSIGDYGGQAGRLDVPEDKARGQHSDQQHHYAVRRLGGSFLRDCALVGH